MADASIDDFLGVKPQAPWKRYVKWVVIAVGVVLLCLLLAKCFGAKEQTQYSTQAAQRGNLTVSVSATGKLAPTTQVTVGSQLSGLVTKVVVDVNDRVTAGQPLALIALYAALGGGWDSTTIPEAPVRAPASSEAR